MVGRAEQNIHAELPGAGSMLPSPQVPPAVQPMQGFTLPATKGEGHCLFPGKGFLSPQFWS